jgi:hypothetical protein
MRIRIEGVPRGTAEFSSVQLSVESKPVKRRLRKRRYVCCTYSETLINPLPEYD